MARAKQKDARDRAAGRLDGRPKALRRELSDLETELERARTRRDRAQARVEALEAIAEQLTVAIASADAARDARRASKGTDTPDAEVVAAAPEPVPLTRSRRRDKASEGTATDDGSSPEEQPPAARPRRSRKGTAAS
jgi:hypothetical protein